MRRVECVFSPIMPFQWSVLTEHKVLGSDDRIFVSRDRVWRRNCTPLGHILSLSGNRVSELLTTLPMI